MSADDSLTPSEKKGPIAWMTRNSVASNLLMVAILLAGIFLGLFQVRQEVFPEFSLDVISVRVPYPGASPDEVEQGIVLAVEEEVRGIDGVKSVNSVAAEGYGNVSVELLLGANPDKVLAEVKNAVDRITSFPEDAEEPSASLLSVRRRVISMFLSGDQDLATLQAIAEDARAKLIAGNGVTYVDVRGVPPLEVSIEIPQETLQQYGLTLDEVALRVRASSVELPAGGVDTAGGEILVKVDDRRRSADEFRSIVVRGTPGGGVLTLGDIATIRDAYAENDQATYLDGKSAVEVVAYRVGSESPQQVSDAVKAFAEELGSTLPNQVDVTLLKDDSELLRQRIDLLVWNAVQGLILVLLILYLFLNVRLAFWVAIGIPISFLGAFSLMPGLDITINMISLFAFIITLGLVVDDAIVIGENVYEKLEQGYAPTRAAILGAREMAVPVTFAILTTIAAFAPMFFVPGTAGKLFRILPGIALAVLMFSLIESFFVLPAHLGHVSFIEKFIQTRLSFLDWPSKQVAKGLAWFIDNLYRPTLNFAVSMRYAVVAAALALFIVTVGVVWSGAIAFTPFPVLEGNTVTATVRLPYGTPVERTDQVRQLLEQGAQKALGELGESGIADGMIARVGEGPTPGGPGGGTPSIGSHLLTVELELIGSENRDVSAEQVSRAWERNVPPIPGLQSLKFNSNVGPSGDADVQVQLTHTDYDTLIRAAERLTERMRGYSDLTAVQNTYSAGKEQYSYSLTDSASTLGLTANDVGRQMRAAYFGSEALREQRGRNEVKVMVRMPKEQRSSLATLERLRIRTQEGGFVPLAQVADLTPGSSPTDILREDGKRVVDVSALLSEGVASNQKVVTDLNESVFPELKKAFPGLELRYAGGQAELGESLSALGLYYIIALVVIYALLAIPFRSYFQPIIVMLAIPLGFVGAVGGHLLLGYSLSMVSMFGIVALSGVVINDSLVLIDAANTYRRQNEGSSAYDAIVFAGTRRLRPILLTSFTTFFGLLPLIFETSVQARFIIPMAISLGFGILFATFVILLVIPAGYLILEDALAMFRNMVGRLDRGEASAKGDAEPHGVPAPAK
ncbi:MAG: efflux RND transporter permease subunit [Myxococcota bacterium]